MAIVDKRKLREEEASAVARFYKIVLSWNYKQLTKENERKISVAVIFLLEPKTVQERLVPSAFQSYGVGVLKDCTMLVMDEAEKLLSAEFQPSLEKS